ncbi:hypothetical protein ACLOJK_027249 [Asimina triloba]
MAVEPSPPATAPSARRLLRHRFRPTTATTSRRPSASVRHFLHPADLHHRSGGHTPSADQFIDRTAPGHFHAAMGRVSLGQIQARAGSRSSSPVEQFRAAASISSKGVPNSVRPRPILIRSSSLPNRAAVPPSISDPDPSTCNPNSSE